VVLIDHDVSPSQARNLERATGAEVLDRSAVILAIFQRHARSREARLQVEIARLAYMAPRLRESGGGDRQSGQGRHLAGEGLGRGDTDLGTSAHCDMTIRHAFSLRADGIDDTPYQRAFFACFLH
jgi:GTP-binding protein HflX